MSDKVTTTILQHIKASSYVDEQVDQFDAFAISWKDEDAIHLTFGRNTVNVKTTRFYVENGEAGVESGDMEVLRLDVAALTIPMDTARELVALLTKMIGHADARRAKDE